jgi:alkylation response protein AidB-like acyl-CoA dehydrogenase
VTLIAPEPKILSVGEALERIAARANGLDRSPQFPDQNFLDLQAAGVLCLDRYRAAAPLREQIAVVRAVANADASTARILDGHLNGVERILTSGAEQLGADELAEVAAGVLWVGVWGADPVGGEGDPAWLARDDAGRLVLRGTKVFCSGAGGVHRALVVARDHHGGRRLAYIDAGTGLHIDREWYRASGLRASESHRVVFADTPVLALLGGVDELLRQPDFARDGVRSAAIWAGLCDGVAGEVAAALAGGAGADAHQDAAFGRMHVEAATIDLWLTHSARFFDGGDRWDDARCIEMAIATRAAIATASRTLAACSLQVCGSRALATLEGLDRRRRDLEVFVLQHRLEPQLQTLGATLRTAAL